MTSRLYIVIPGIVIYIYPQERVRLQAFETVFFAWLN